MFCTIWQHHKQIKLIFVRNRVTAYNKRKRSTNIMQSHSTQFFLLTR